MEAEPGLLRHTPLHALHVELGARMAPFAGYDMPIRYPLGVLKEHLHVREKAGLFDVSHMGQVEIVSPAGFAAAAAALERLIPIDILELPPGRQRYGFLTNEAGGIIDDLMVARLGDQLILVVNAANARRDIAYLTAALGPEFDVRRLDRALLALQGPQAEAVLARRAPQIAQMRFLDVRSVEVEGADCFVSRSGYTGEDGFEISIPKEDTARLARIFLTDPAVAPIGLGARDSLRLEAGLPLHGADIDIATTPVEAGLSWAIPKVRRQAGARSGGFPGADLILQQMLEGAKKQRVGLRPEGRAPIRAGAPLFTGDSQEPIGAVTSGSFGPSLGGPVAMGYVPAEYSTRGLRIFTELRGQRLALDIAALPFVPARLKRG